MDEIKIDKLTLDASVLNSISAELTKELSQAVTEYVKGFIQEVGAVATGDLLNSITSSVLGTSSGGLLLAVGSSNDAAEAIEYGLPPGTNVDVNSIKKWMLSKGLDPSDKSAVSGIINKIYSEGIKAKAPFEAAYNSSEFNGIIDSTIDKIVNKADWAS